MAASISHMRLWQHCIDINEPIMILEHDAIFQRQFKYKEIALCGTSHVGSNGSVKMYGSDPVIFGKLQIQAYFECLQKGDQSRAHHQ